MNKIYPSIAEYEPNIDKINVANTVQYWGFFEKAELKSNNGKLLMLDIDFGRKCSLRCPSCFRKSNNVDKIFYNDLDYYELLDIIDEALKIGLKEVKVCGAGEPLENPQLLQFARDLTDRGIGLSIFTKAHVLGDNNLVEKYFNIYGIKEAEALCDEFFKLKTSFLVSFQSLVPEIQNRLVGNVNGYALKRNKGLEILAQAGFNKTIPTRLAMCANPLVKENLNEILDIYIYCRKRNILPINAMLMVSGKQIDKEFLKQNDVTELEKERLFLDIYKYNINNGYNTPEQITKDGISCMPGIHPCNQIAVGLYLTCNGNVIRCPGDYDEPLGNVHEESISSIWNRNKAWAYKDKYNCRCPYKEGITIHSNLYSNVLHNILKIYN